MKKSTKYRIFWGVSLIPWCWMVVPEAGIFICELIAAGLIIASQWLHRHKMEIPEWSKASKMRRIVRAAEWQEYAERPDADPRVLAGRPKS